MKEKSLKAVHDIAATCNDAAEGFAKAAKGVHDKNLSDWLATASADRQGFADDLNKILEQMGEDARLDLHEGGILHRGWVDLEQRLRSTEEHLRSKDDDEIVKECIAGDSGSLQHYDHALAQDLPAEFRSTILEQKAAIQDQLMYLQNRISGPQARAAATKQ